MSLNTFKSKSLQLRLFFGLIFIGSLIFGIGMIGLLTTLRLSNTIERLDQYFLPITNGLWKVSEGKTQIESAERALISPDLSESQKNLELERIRQAWEQIETGLQEYEAALPYGADKQRFEKIQESLALWKRDHEELIRQRQQFDVLGISNPYTTQISYLKQGRDNGVEMNKAIESELALKRLQQRSQYNQNSFNQVSQIIETVLQEHEQEGNEVVELAEKRIRWAKMVTVVSIIAGLVLLIVFWLYFANRILNKDFKTLIQRLQETGINITTATTEISASGKQLEGMVAEQQASTTEVTATAHEIAATAKNLFKTTENVIEQAQITAHAAKDSQDELQDMESTMRQLTEATHSITSKLGIMNKKAGNISNVVVTITKVADQTSILSLNAAIEAEKAGEYGAGFAVVAREIRRLANQTAVATLEIEQIVKDMQSAVAVGVMEMDKFSKSVSDSVERVNKISNQIADVIEQVQSLPPQFMQVGQGMDEQAQGAQQISEAMGQLSEASHQTVESLRDTNNALLQLNDTALHLRDDLTQFRLT